MPHSAAHAQKPGDAMVLNELIRHLSSAGQDQSDSAKPLYDEALRLSPAYNEAIEYRGEAYLGLNRIEDAKAA